MKCPSCGAPVEWKRMRSPFERRQRGWYVDADGSGMRRHVCEPEPLEVVQWDRCECGAVYGRVNGGPRLDMRTWELHQCPKAAPTPEPTPIRQQSVEPPAMKPWRLIP